MDCCGLNLQQKDNGVETKQLIKELVARIEDQKFDPEPQYDAVLSDTSIANRELLLKELKMVLNENSKI